MPLVNKSFSDIITFTRPGGGGRTNAQGQYEWLPANQPRIDYDPVTGECRGLLIEGQRTNLLRYSSDFTNGVWGKEKVLLVPGSTLAPDGTATASKLTESADTGLHNISVGSLPTTIGVSYTVSLFAKPDGSGRCLRFALFSHTVNIDLETMEYKVHAGVGFTVSVDRAPHGFVRVSLRGVVNTGASNTFISIAKEVGTPSNNYQGDGESGIYIWGAQLEVGSFPTSYIPTTTAQVTRAADIASVNELSPWFNPEAGTLFAEYSRQWETSTTQGRVAYLSGADTAKTLQIRALGNGSAAGTIADAGTVNADITSAVLPISSSRVALAWGAAGASMAANGLLSGVDGSVVIPQGLTTLWLGNSFGSGQLMGHIRVLRYFPRRLSDAELQALTA